VCVCVCVCVCCVWLYVCVCTRCTFSLSAFISPFLCFSCCFLSLWVSPLCFDYRSRDFLSRFRQSLSLSICLSLSPFFLVYAVSLPLPSLPLRVFSSLSLPILESSIDLSVTHSLNYSRSHSLSLSLARSLARSQSVSSVCVCSHRSERSE
jgi:hypothetical protein